MVNFSGKQIGLYRETSHLLPIVARAPAEERLEPTAYGSCKFGLANTTPFVPATQVVSNFNTEWKTAGDAPDRMRMLAVMADPKLGSDETADSAA